MQALALRASVDEARHVAMCARLARTYGARVQVDAPPTSELEPQELSLEDATLAEIVSLCCIGETLSAAAFGAILESAEPREIRDVAQSIVHDEALHAELGWSHLEAQVALGRDAFLSRRLPGLVANGIPDDFRSPAPDLRDDETSQARVWGLLPAAKRRAILRDTFDALIWPKLDTLGIDTVVAREWLAERNDGDPPSR